MSNKDSVNFELSRKKTTFAGDYPSTSAKR